MKNHTSKFLTLVVTALFAICTIHLIIRKPAYYYYNSANEISDKQRAALNSMGSLKKRSLTKDDKQELTSMKDLNSNDISNVTKFIIFDASQYSGSLSFLNAKNEGWLLLLVNLRNLSQLVTCEACLLLKDEWIKSDVIDMWWNNSTQSELDSNGLAKLAAYAYALSRGATWIYTTDRPVQVPYETLDKVSKHEVRTGLVYHGPETVFEPCNHFMDPYAWQGFGNHKNQGRYNVKVVSSHSVFHVINDCFKDGMDLQTWQNSIDAKAPVPYIMPGLFSAIDFNNVLVSGPNAWILIASAFPKSQDTGLPTARAIQMNLMVQRVLWDSQGALGFLADKSSVGYPCQACDQERNNWKFLPKDFKLRHICPTSFLQAQLKDETEEIFQSNLTQWRCDFFETVPKCLLKLSKEIFVPYNGMEHIVDIWLSMLDGYGWKPLDRVVFSDERATEHLTGIPVYFSPAKSLHKKVNNQSRPANPFRQLCREGNKTYSSKIPQNHVFHDIILIVIFNFGNLVSNIPLLDYVYGRHFKYVIYCSESIVEFENRYQKHFNANPVTFIEIKHKRGYWGQSCMAATMKMGYDVTGFLQISDDVLLNVWNLDKLPYNAPWFQSSMRVASIHSQIVPDVWINNYWWPWNQFFGRVAAVNAYNQLKAMMSNPTDGDRVSKFMENLYNITNCHQCFLYEASDIFYVPRHLISDFTFFSDIFSHTQVFLEITIPTVLAGITSDFNVYRLRGNYLWFQDREKYPFVYTKYDHFYHALKYSQLSIKKDLEFFCVNFLGRIDKDALHSKERYRWLT